jgi:tRNA threonylcarbamoyladenosine biosynthesis protein TsaE
MSDMMSLSRDLADEAATVALGAELGRVLCGGMLVFLEGDLGAGKTTLCRGLLGALGHEGAVKSPTYTLVEPYEETMPPVYHFDLYRLGDPEELDLIGIRDYLDAAHLCLVEWPERGAGVLPPADLHISIALSGTGRRVLMTPRSARARRALAPLELAPLERGKQDIT